MITSGNKLLEAAEGISRHSVLAHAHIWLGEFLPDVPIELGRLRQSSLEGRD